MRAENKPGLAPATVVAVFGLLVGFAFVRLSNVGRIAERRAAAAQAARLVSDSIEMKVQGFSERIEGLAADIGQLGALEGVKSATRSGNVIPGENLIFVPVEPKSAQDFIALGRTAGKDLNIVGWITDPKANAAPSPRAELLRPQRNRSGEWAAVLRAPVFFANSAGAKSLAGWIVSSFELNDLLESSGAARLPASGFDFQFGFLAPNNPRLLAVAGSSESELPNPVRQAIRPAPDQWLLQVAPIGGWTSWALILAQSILIVLFSLFGALWVYGFARRPAALRAQVEARDARLRTIHQRLSEEIEQREELEKQFSRASFEDALTGLPNRSHFMERLGRALQRARLRPGYIMAVIILNFDRFKNINESMGTAVGDQLLTQAVRRLEQCLRPEDWMVARLGGDEFGMLLFDIGSAQGAEAAAKRLQDALAEPFQIENQNVFTSASMGIALSASGYEDAEELVRGAHIALSKAKADGLGQHAIFDPATREQIVTRQQLETDLHQAVERNEFCLNFQPIVSLESGHITGMESLVRWRHPLEGMILPSRFIPLAEETGLVVPMTRWVLREACRQASAWRQQFPDDIGFYLSVNLSAQDLRQPDVCDFVAEVLQETGLPPGVLRLEVTESMMIGNIKAVSELVSRFRAMGVPLLLDDFGTGYSSLSYLNRFHFDYIKIDQAFVRRSMAGEESAGIVRAIVHLAQDLGSKTIAEGVETSQNVEQLSALGCDYAQGYYFSKPVDSKGAEKLLLSRPIWQNALRLADTALIR